MDVADRDLRYMVEALIEISDKNQSFKMLRQNIVEKMLSKRISEEAKNDKKVLEDECRNGGDKIKNIKQEPLYI